MIVKAFLKRNHAKTGIDRFVQTLTVHPDVTFHYLDSLEEISTHSCDIGIFGGFLPRELESIQHIPIKYYVFCSPFGQADLSSQDFYSAETDLLLELSYFISQGIIKNALTASKSLAWRFGFIHIPPYKLIDDNELVFNQHREYYGMLGNNFRKHRNVVNQIAAISWLDPIQSISIRHAKVYEYYGQLFNCTFIEQDLTTDEQYNEAISKHILSFQCSWSEAFSYLAFEYALMGVPTIVGPSIDWYPDKDCIVQNVDNPREIYEVAQNLLSDKMNYMAVSYNLRKWAIDFNKDNKEKLQEVIQSIL